MANHDNESLRALILSKLSKHSLKDDSPSASTFIRDTLSGEDCLEVRDYFYQITKSLSGALTTSILPQK